MSEEILINVNLQGDGDVDKVDKKIEKLGKTTNKTQNEMTRLRKELRDAKSDMLLAEEGSEEYARALSRVADAQFRLKDINDKARLAVRDFGEISKNTARAVAGLSGGFTATIGVMGLFAGENENLQKAILGVQSALAVTQGLATFADSLDSMKDLINGLGLNNVTNSVTELGSAAASSADDVSKLSSEAAVLGSNLAGTVATNEKLDKGLKGVEETIKKTTVSVEKNKNVLVGVDAFLLRFPSMLGRSTNEGVKLSEISKEYLKNIGLMDRTTEQLLVSEKMAGDALSEYSKKLKEFNELSDESADVVDTQTEAQNKSNESVKKGITGITDFGKSIIKSLVSMAAFMAIIAGVTLLISKLIEKINEIPEEVKLKLELEENIIKDTQKAMEEIAQIRQNITLASNKKELDLIKEKLLAEGIATKEQLKGLNDSKELLNAAFWDEYLENVKLVAENEYLIRKDVELRLQKELAQMKFNTAEKERQKLIDAGKTGLFQGTFGLNLEMLAAEKEIKKLSNQLKVFQEAFYNSDGKLKLNPVKFELKGTSASTPKGTTKSPIIQQLYPILTQKEIDDYIKDLAERTNKAIEKEFALGSKQQEKDKLLQSLGGLVGQLTPEQLDAQYEEILKKREEFVQKERTSFEKQMEVYQSYADSLASISDSIVSLYDARLTAVDNYYNAEARLIENSLLTEEEKNKKLSELDEKRYKEQSALFEQQKKWQEAFVYLNLASGLMNIYTRATLPVPLGGIPSPFNWIAAGLETAALIGQSVSQIANIRQQQLNAPSGGSQGSISPNISIMNPNKTTLTTKEENLNMIQQSSKNNNVSVVRVSEINEVQNKVSVRENNSSF